MEPSSAASATQPAMVNTTAAGNGWGLRRAINRATPSRAASPTRNGHLGRRGVSEGRMLMGTRGRDILVRRVLPLLKEKPCGKWGIVSRGKSATLAGRDELQSFSAHRAR